MKARKIAFLWILALVLSLTCTGIMVFADSYSAVWKAPAAATVGNYTEFYKLLNNAVCSKSEVVTVNINKYDKKTYDIQAVLSKILDANKNLKYTMSQYKASISTKGSSATIKLTFVYESVDLYIESGDEFVKAVCDAAYNLQDTVKLRISKYDPNLYKTSAILEQKLKNNGYLYYLSDLKGSWAKSAIGNSGIMTVKLVYSYPKADLARMGKEIDAKLNEIISKVISFDMTEADKELALHDYIIEHTVLTGSTYLDSQSGGTTPYGVLVEGKGNSLGIASTMQLVLKKAGLESIVVTGGSEAWNIVSIGGQYYHLDVASDFWKCDDKFYAAHGYFNLTDAEISKIHTWNKSAYPRCTSTSSNYFVLNKTMAYDANQYYDLVKSSIEQVREYVSIKTPYYDDKIYNISEVIRQIGNNNPELDYVREWQWQIDHDMGVINLLITYDYPREKLLSMKKETQDKVKEIVKKLITPGMTDYDKELALHDYVVKNARYDYENVDKDTVPFDEHAAYGVLVKGIGVCDSYAEAMKLLLGEAGVECLVVEGDAISKSGSADTKYGHAWNIIKLDGEYYQFDATWDDVRNEDGTESLEHYFLNMTDEEAGSLYTWDTNKYPKCTGTKYNYYVKNNLVVDGSAELQSSIVKVFNRRGSGLTVKIQDYKNSGISIEDVIKSAFYKSSLHALNGARWRVIPELGIVEIIFEY